MEFLDTSGGMPSACVSWAHVDDGVDPSTASKIVRNSVWQVGFVSTIEPGAQPRFKEDSAGIYVMVTPAKSDVEDEGVAYMITPDMVKWLANSLAMAFSVLVSGGMQGFEWAALEHPLETIVVSAEQWHQHIKQQIIKELREAKGEVEGVEGEDDR